MLNLDFGEGRCKFDQQMLVSVIIPTFNEGARIAELINYIRCDCEGSEESEVIVADGYSTDQTIVRSAEAGARTIQATKGRGGQMNCGAAIALGEILFFLHADTVPPRSFIKDIVLATSEGYAAGCYRLAFDHDHWFLRFNSWFTRFDFTPFRFGDQGLFIHRQVFQKIRGFDPGFLLLEDQEIISRIKRIARFKIFDKPVMTSARKYMVNGIFKLQFIFILIYSLYQVGFPQDKLMQLYKMLIRDERMEPLPAYFFRRSEAAASAKPPVSNKGFQ